MFSRSPGTLPATSLPNTLWPLLRVMVPKQYLAPSYPPLVTAFPEIMLLLI